MRKSNPASAFTLIELLAVIAIIAVIAAIVAPTLGNLRKGDAMAVGTRQMLDAVARARQLAISQRTTVYLTFVSDDFWGANSTTFLNTLIDPVADPRRQRLVAATNITEKQLTGYNFVTLRTVGDQPGRGVPHYLSSWQTLPESIFIQPTKFLPAGTQLIINDPNRPPPAPPVTLFQFYSFNTNAIPFPTESSPLFNVPCVAFDYQGRLLSGRDEYIPMVHGSLGYSIDPVTKLPQMQSPTIFESPPGNSSNSFNVIHIDWLTGRGRLEKRQIQ
jgi:prepilin-type N-terminal cleavage/methylation domain-containing protein